MTQPLSPTAQAVLDAAEKAYQCPGVDYQADLMAIGAAAIHALAERTLPEEPPPHRGMRPGGSTLTWQESLSVERQRIRATQLAVAAELEGE